MDFRNIPIPVFKLDAVPHKDIASFSKVFSLAEIEYFLYVQIPVNVAQYFELCQVSEIRDEAEVISSEGLWEHDPRRIWYRFNTEKLNREPGYHIYRLLFVNRFSQETCMLYISYTIQSNNPEKPYNYMEKYDV